MSGVLALKSRSLLRSTDVLDGAMITLAMFTLNISHPGYPVPHPSQHRYSLGLFASSWIIVTGVVLFRVYG